MYDFCWLANLRIVSINFYIVQYLVIRNAFVAFFFVFIFDLELTV